MPARDVSLHGQYGRGMSPAQMLALMQQTAGMQGGGILPINSGAGFPPAMQDAGGGMDMSTMLALSKMLKDDKGGSSNTLGSLGKLFGGGGKGGSSTTGGDPTYFLG